jgi:hypothetical protein
MSPYYNLSPIKGQLSLKVFKWCWSGVISMRIDHEELIGANNTRNLDPCETSFSSSLEEIQ